MTINCWTIRRFLAEAELQCHKEFIDNRDVPSHFGEFHGGTHYASCKAYVRERVPETFLVIFLFSILQLFMKILGVD